MLKVSGLLGCALAFVLAGCVAEPTSVNLNPTGGSGGGTGTGTGGSGGGSGGSGTGGSTGSGMTGAAHDYFIDNVYSPMSGECGGCHVDGGGVGAPIFMAGNAEGTYNAIEGANLIAIPDNSVLVLHGVHTGPAMSAGLDDMVREWLEMEAAERGLAGGGGTGGGGGTPPGKTLQQALDEFAACMDLQTWIDTGMDDVPLSQTGNGGPCYSCHSAGDGGTWLSLNTEETFNMNREFPFVKRLVTGTVDENGAFETLIPAMRYIQKGEDPCGENQNCHPVYSLSPAREQAVLDFVDLTIQAWENGECTVTP